MSGPASVADLVERLAEEMVGRWADGERPAAEEYLGRHPELWDRPDAALELIAQEIALREEHGRPADGAELVRRFPRWRTQVLALLGCQRALGPNRGPSFPAPGQRLGEFRLVAELGRGAWSRAYLATQPALADRPVVLKLSPESGREHLSLARLQHSHIVPLYSAHAFPDRGLRGLCLPYFGGATLAELLAVLTEAPGDLLSALRRLRLAAPAISTGQPVEDCATGPACDFLGRASRAEAVCWIGACLADALQYAHERGLLHLDLKPSNVLIAIDGTPMLLDFHLASGPLEAGDPAPPRLGGTPGYMAPEHEAALRAVREGSPVPAAVDARADVYALGVLLSEALGPPPVSVGLRDLLARCTAADAADRYPTASALADDLRRHLSDLPLRGVGNRSLAERYRKWRRRRPYALPLLAGLVALAVAGTGLFAGDARRAGRSEAALRDGEAYFHQGRYAEAVEALRGGEAVAEGLPFRRSLTSRLREARQRAERGLAAEELHALCERVRPLYAADAIPAEQVRTAEARCRELWEQRGEIARRLADQPTPERERRWRADLLDLGILTAHLHARSAPPGEAEPAHRRALEVLAETESLLGPSAVLYRERTLHAVALGMRNLADESLDRARSLPPRTAWEHLAVGRACLAAGELGRAAEALDRCLELEPQSFWGNYHRGTCSLRLGKPDEAVASFTACIALSPRSAWCYSNRGLAHAAAGRPEQARADFERARALGGDDRVTGK